MLHMGTSLDCTIDEAEQVTGWEPPRNDQTASPCALSTTPEDFRARKTGLCLTDFWEYATEVHVQDSGAKYLSVLNTYH